MARSTTGDGDPTAMLDALDRGDRACALEGALTAYFGASKRPPPSGMPRPIATLFTRFDEGLIRQNELVDPRTHSSLFYRENQDCERWSFTDDADDSLVVRAGMNGEAFEGERLDRFVVQMVVFEASIGALLTGRCGELTSRQLEVAVRGWTEPFAATEWFGTTMRLFVASGVVAHTLGDWLMVRAIDESSLGELQRLKVDWDVWPP